eukprot:2597083-Amphidinium_carterae.2
MRPAIGGDCIPEQGALLQHDMSVYVSRVTYSASLTIQGMIAVNPDLVGRTVLVHDSCRKVTWARVALLRSYRQTRSRADRQARACVLREMMPATGSMWSRTVTTNPGSLP